MQGKVTLEDHFAIEATLGDSQPFGTHVWPELRHRLLDFQDQRLRLMDASGVEIMIASLNAPAIQGIPDTKHAAEVARQANDVLAGEIAKRPDRFVGVAALPMQKPELATRELERCIKELGFKGALVNGYSQTNEPTRVLHYDLPQYRPFWHTVETLDVPFYLHPRPPAVSSPLYEGHRWLFGPTWTFAAETSVHALRLIGSGLFDEHPRLQIILGHLGEGLPYYLWRIDNRNNWMKAPHKGVRNRGGAGHVLGRLPLRGFQRCGRLVRSRGNQRSRSPQDRTHECDDAVQVGWRVKPAPASAHRPPGVKDQHV